MLRFGKGLCVGAALLALLGCGGGGDGWGDPNSPYRGEYAGSWSDGTASGHVDWTVDTAGAVAATWTDDGAAGTHVGTVADDGQYTGSMTTVGSADAIATTGVLALADGGVVGTLAAGTATIQLTLVRQ